MNGHISRYGVDDRDHLVHFLRKFYKRFSADGVQDERMTPQTLGKNWSSFLYERYGKRFLCLFDGDDGSGGTPSDCKLNWTRFQNLIDHHRVDDYLIFKIQFAPTSEQRMFYPFKRDVYPLALMTNDPDRIFKIADELPKVEEDIDVLFVGGRVHDHNHPYCWPKNREKNQHWPTNRRIGYAKLLEIKERRKDLNIVAIDQLAKPDEYYNLVNRAKICLDFPGIGLSSRKFYEFAVMGKCILSLDQNVSCIGYEAWEHYASMGRDYTYTNLEHAIDHLVIMPSVRAELGRKAKSLRFKMSHEAVGQHVAVTLDGFVDSYFDATLDSKRSIYE